ncbi:EAL domain-containing protein [Betaproteobacteria bacterium SCN2]|jgi:diguanylate cyclase (GGDEF)-like protein|nr:EAL domain-containing protein [Betaproteobacteria bacterium SCN2]
MRQNQQLPRISISIVAGFLIVLALMISLAVVGLRYISEANARLKDIVENNNLKTALATDMQSALRERALSMHAMSILTDPFDKEAEMERFYGYGSVYLSARERLEQLPLSRQERETLSRISALMGESNPEVLAVMEMGLAGNDQEIFDRIRNKALPKQRKIADEVSALIRLQHELTDAAIRRADSSYAEVRSLMIALGSSAVLVGLLVTFYVSRRAGLQAKQLTTQALYDSLTGLPNRSLLRDRIEQAIAHARRSNRPFCIAMMDLNRFKEVNDTLGHNVGDELLREVSRRLRKIMRAEDTVARMGGDEFVLVLQGLGKDGIPAFARKLHSALETAFFWGSQRIDISASTGIALFPSHAEDASSLIRYADIAMYMAKRSGRDYALYSPDQEQVNRDRLSLKSQLREAIQSGQLTLHYQPKIDHRTCQVTGVEALARWNHPEKGMLAPDSFIPLAEEAGLIEEVTHWVLKTAIAQLAALHAGGHRLTMGVNLSARNLHEIELPGTVATLLAANGVAPQYLTLEITESAVMFNPADAVSILGKLDRMGVILAIDDFGTGYSSLAHLRQLPVDEIKIDKSFVIDMEQNENDAVIVRSIIDLAHNLGLKAVAEGVDTRDAWDTLTILGCDCSQGYYLCKPLPQESLLSWLDDSAALSMAALQPARGAASS